MRYVSVTWSCMWLCLWLVTCDWLCSCRCSFAKRPRRSKKDRQETPRWLRYHQHGVEKSSTWAKMGPRMAGQEAKEIMALSGSDNIHNQFSRGFHVNVAVCLYDISFNTISASIIVFSYFSVLAGSARFHYPFLRAHYCIGCARSMCIMYRNLEFHRSRLEKHVTAARTKMVRIILIVKHCLCLMYRTVGLQGIASLQESGFLQVHL